MKGSFELRSRRAGRGEEGNKREDGNRVRGPNSREAVAGEVGPDSRYQFGH